jgi:hypothetical protein
MDSSMTIRVSVYLDDTDGDLTFDSPTARFDTKLNFT